jgi:predicted nucleic acid-binding protein
VIVDASALIASFGDRSVARTLRGSDLAAPDLLVPETLNAFWKIARLGGSAPERALVLALLDQIRIVPSRANAARAAELAEQLDHPVYDCLYLALAESEADVLVTADAAFAAKLRNRTLRKRIRLVTI